MNARELTKRLLKSERGAAIFALTLVAMFASVLIVIPIVTFAGTVMVQRTRITQPEGFYARDAGIESALRYFRFDATYVGCIFNPSPLSDPLCLAMNSAGHNFRSPGGHDDYNIAVGGIPVHVTVDKAALAAGVEPPRLYIFVQENPVIFRESLPQTVTYDVQVVNDLGRPVSLEQLTVNLYSPFVYVTGTSYDVTHAAPVSNPGGGGNLVWTFSPPHQIDMHTIETLRFQVQVPAGTSTGSYYASATARLTGIGLKSAQMAPVNVVNASPLDVTASVTPNQVEDLFVDTDFHYKLVITNTSTTVDHTLKTIVFWTYHQFQLYPGSTHIFDHEMTSSEVCSDGQDVSDPGENRGDHNGPFDWKWAWGPSDFNRTPAEFVTIQPGDTHTFCFTAHAKLNAGIYYGRAIVDDTNAHEPEIDTGPTSPITIKGNMLVTATGGGRTQTAVVTLGEDDTSGLVGLQIAYWEAR